MSARCARRGGGGPAIEEREFPRRGRGTERPGLSGWSRTGPGAVPALRGRSGVGLPVSAERCPGAVRQQVEAWGSTHGSRPWLVPQQY